MVWPTQNDLKISAILPPNPNVSANQGSCKKSVSRIDYLSKLNISSRAETIRLSGIVCTIGPASKQTDFLVQMIDDGMNIARMNFSHGSYEYHGDTIKNCREAVLKYKEMKGFNPCLAIALDTKGPEIRTGLLQGDDGRKEIMFEKDDIVKLTTDEDFKEKCTKDVIYLDYKNITKVMEVGKRVYIDDGLISVVATEIGDNYVLGKVENGGNLGSRKGCNLPGTDCDLPAVSEKDKNDLLFGVEQGVDMVFASFIRDANGVKEIRAILGDKGKNILIIPKIENQQGLNNIDEIIAESDGIMVARGDMGIEIPPEKVFIAQKQIIAKCNKAGKPVINATQMLESMVKKPRPTRAEGTDVANAILDGADCVMLSGETAKGDYPLQCIQIMSSLAREAEVCFWNESFHDDLIKSQHLAGQENSSSTSSAISAVRASFETKAKAIIVVANNGKLAQKVSQFKPKCPIISLCNDQQVARQLQLNRGILPLIESGETEEKRLHYGFKFGKELAVFDVGSPVVYLTDSKVEIMDVN